MIKDEYSTEVMDALDRIEELKLNGEHEKSIQEAQRLLFSDPDCVGALEELADNYVSLERYEEAIKACNRAMKLTSKSYTAHYILGFIFSQRQQWAPAVEHLRKSNTMHPNNAEVLRCLGWANFNGGKRTRGLMTLERALNLDPENSLTLCDLGICYMQVKKFDRSIQLLKHAMELDPKNPRIRECYKAALGLKKLNPS